MRSQQVGDLEIVPVDDGYFTIPQPPLVRGEDAPEFAIHRSYIPGDGLFYTQLGAFLVRTGDRVVLLDAGLGPACGHAGTYCPEHADETLLQKFDAMWRNFGRDEDYIRYRRENLSRTIIHHGRLEDSLRASGVDPSEITDVAISHLHCDHMGWCSKEGRPFFANADIWVHEADVAHFLGSSGVDDTGTRVLFGVEGTKERMEPALRHLRTWDKDVTIAPGIDLRHMPGHTPGSSIAAISSKGERAMVLGDVIHCPLEMTDEEFSLMADLDKVLARRTKDALLREIEDGSVHVASTHFPGMRFGRLLKSPVAHTRTFSWSP